MTERIAQRFSELRKAGRAGLIPFIVAGDPDVTTSREIVLRLPSAGADFLEIGLPAQAPLMDGPVIQASHRRAVESGAGVLTALNLAADARKAHPDLPIILMGYSESILAAGPAAFLGAAAELGVDAMLLVDTPLAKRNEWAAVARRAGLDWVQIAKGNRPELEDMGPAWARSGFTYCVASPDKTGGTPPAVAAVAAVTGHIRQATGLPAVVGFGVRTQVMASAVGAFADAVAVGTVVVEAIARTLGQPGEEIVQSVCDTVSELAAGINLSQLTSSRHAPK